MKLEPIVYDLKRGILRKSVLIILVAFVMGGIGIAYLTYQLTSTTVFQGLFYAHFTLSPNGQLEGSGILADKSLKDVEGSLLYRIMCRGDKDEWGYEGSARVKGVFAINGSIRDAPEWVFGNGTSCTLDISLTTPHGYYVSSSDIYRWDDGTLWAVSWSAGPFSRLPIYEKVDKPGSTTPVGEIHAFAIKNGAKANLLIASIMQRNISLSVYVMEIQPESPYLPVIPEDPEKVGFRKVGSIRTGISLISFELMNESTTILSPLFAGDGLFAGPGLLPFFEGYTSSAARRVTATMLQQSSSLFNFFFPIVALYLAYIYIAKPRAQGALEFLIARPITRLDLFTTRYVAGVLVLVASSILFIASLNVAIYAIFSTAIEGYVLMLLLGSTIASLVAFYSLCYFVSTVAKGGSYLALTIFLYLFFTIIMNIIVSILAFLMPGGHGIGYEDFLTALYRLIAASWLLNPLGASSIAQFFITAEMGYMPPTYIQVVKEVLQPWAISLSIAGWIVIPVALGWLKFRKINLSQ